MDGRLWSLDLRMKKVSYFVSSSVTHVSTRYFCFVFCFWFSSSRLTRTHILPHPLAGNLKPLNVTYAPFDDDEDAPTAPIPASEREKDVSGPGLGKRMTRGDDDS